jgi:hypothetical protein
MKSEYDILVAKSDYNAVPTIIPFRVKWKGAGGR